MQAWRSGSGGGADAADRAGSAACWPTRAGACVDADALTALAPTDCRRPRAGTRRSLLTPHAGELARLLGVDRADVEARRLRARPARGPDLDAVVLLKGSTTVVARPDGRSRVNPTGRRRWPPPAPGTCWPACCGALLAGGLDPSTRGSAAPGCTAWPAGWPPADGASDHGGRRPGRLPAAAAGRDGSGSTERVSVTGMRAARGVDLDAIRDNVGRAARARTDGRGMAVVKADGYGHGLLPSARAALAGGATWLGAALLDEALALRAAGITAPRVLAWLHRPGRAAGPTRCAPTSTCRSRRLGARRGRRRGPRDRPTGPGAPQGRHRPVPRRRAPLADWPDLVEAAAQGRGRRRGRGGRALVPLRLRRRARPPDDRPPGRGVPPRRSRSPSAAGLRPEVRHLANSAATLTAPDAHFDLVRPGHRRLRAVPGARGRPARRLRAAAGDDARGRLVLVKRVPAGSGVSYGHTYTTERETTLGLVPLGYADGIPRAGGNVGPGAGRRSAPHGRRPGLHGPVRPRPRRRRGQAGDEVVLFGPATTASPTAQDWADAAGTIAYEIVTRVGPRVPRVYVEASRR